MIGIIAAKVITRYRVHHRLRRPITSPFPSPVQSSPLPFTVALLAATCQGLTLSLSRNGPDSRGLLFGFGFPSYCTNCRHDLLNVRNPPMSALRPHAVERYDTEMKRIILADNQ